METSSKEQKSHHTAHNKAKVELRESIPLDHRPLTGIGARGLTKSRPNQPKTRLVINIINNANLDRACFRQAASLRHPLPTVALLHAMLSV